MIRTSDWRVFAEGSLQSVGTQVCQSQFRVHSQPLGCLSLGIAINQENVFAGYGQAMSEVDGGGSLADSTF